MFSFLWVVFCFSDDLWHGVPYDFGIRSCLKEVLRGHSGELNLFLAHWAHYVAPLGNGSASRWLVYKGYEAFFTSEDWKKKELTEGHWHIAKEVLPSVGSMIKI